MILYTILSLCIANPDTTSRDSFYYDDKSLKCVLYYQDSLLIFQRGFYQGSGAKEFEMQMNGRARINGLYQRWYESGELKSKETYTNDKPQGDGEFYYSDGTKEGYTYWEGRIYFIKKLHKNGQTKSLSEYENDTLIREQRWCDNGQLTADYYFPAFFSESRVYYCNGQLKYYSKTAAKGLLLTGPYKWWYENGKLSVKGQHSDYSAKDPKSGTVKIGKWKYYYENGKREKIECYNKKGNLIKEKCWNENGKRVECEKKRISLPSQ